MDLDYPIRDAFWDSSDEYIESFIRDTTKTFRDASEFLKSQTTKMGVVGQPTMMPSGIPAQYYWTMSDWLQASVENMRQWKIADAQVFANRKRFKPGGGTANDKWWSDTDASRKATWQEYITRQVELAKNIELVVNNISQVPLPAPKVVTGPLTVSDISYLFGVVGDDVTRNIFRPEFNALLSKDQFYIRVIQRANAVGLPAGLKPEKMGYTRKAVDDVYDSIVRGMGLDPRNVNILAPQRMALDNLRRDLNQIKAGMGVDATDVQILNDWVDEVVANLKSTNQFKDSTSRISWHDKRNDAMEAVRTEWGRTYTNYEDGSIVDSVMHGIFPFWTYESQRYPWLWRTFVKHPGLFTGMGRYSDYTDGGYIHIPGTSLEINPFRGSIFMGAFRSLFMRDYPEYFDEFPGLANILDYIGKWGFYPGIHFMLPLTLAGSMIGGKAEWGELLPAWVKTPLQVLRWALPESEPVKRLNELICPDRYVVAQAIKACGEYGVSGLDIWSKLQSGVELRDDEQEIWDKAMGVANGYSALFEQTAFFRFNPQERIDAYNALEDIYEETMGIPKTLQEKIRRRSGVTGKTVTDIFPPDILDQHIIRELDIMKLWAGSNAPLQPSGWQGIDAKINRYWAERELIRGKVKTNFYHEETGELIKRGTEELSEALKKWYRGEPGGIDPVQWRREIGDLKAYAAAAADELTNSEQFKEVPVTIDARKKFYEEQRGIVPTYNPSQELLWMYYDLNPKLEWDEESGIMEYDYDTYYALIDYIIDSLPANLQDRFIQTLQADWSDLEILQWETYRKFIRPYRATRMVTLDMMAPEERALVEGFAHATATEREPMRSITNAEGDKVISQYEQNISTIRENLRLIHPEWNAWISFWYPSTKLLTPQAEKIYTEIMEQNLGQ